MSESTERRAATGHTRAALDALVRLSGELERRGFATRERDERAAVRLRQALELLEGTGPGGFDQG
jgi:hypothetical protein